MDTQTTSEEIRKMATALHEAGHALVCWVQGGEVERIDCNEDPAYVSCVWWTRHDAVAIGYAGAAAASLFEEKTNSRGCSDSDFGMMRCFIYQPALVMLTLLLFFNDPVVLECLLTIAGTVYHNGLVEGPLLEQLEQKIKGMLGGRALDVYAQQALRCIAQKPEIAGSLNTMRPQVEGGGLDEQ